MTDRPPQALRWRDGVVLSLTMPAALVATLGYSIASLGTWSAIVLWGVSMLVATLANLAYAELAAMFPEKAGGIALYASEAWRPHLTLVGPVASFGYWFAWSSSIAVFAGVIGDLVQAQWFPGETWTWDLGVADVTFARLVAAAVIVVVWLANVFGLTPTLWLLYTTAAMLLVPLGAFILLPFLTGDWSADTLTWRLGDPGQAAGGVELALVWLYVMLWTSLGVETCATFTPEYRRGPRDAAIALRVAALLSLGVFVLFPLGAAGAAGEPAIERSPLAFYGAAFERLIGGAADVMVAMIVGSLVLVITTAMADSSRALFGMARDAVTIRALDRVNRFGAPGRPMTVDLLVNLGLVFFLGDTLAIVAAGNLGYVAAHLFALTGFLLLRRDRPRWPRPVRLPRVLVAAIGFVACVLAVVLVVGSVNFDLTGYGGRKELAFALALLGSSVLLYLYRRLVQDGRPVRLREPTVPDTATDV